MTFQIVHAVRKGTPALISLWGPSGSGKTMSALYLARGLVGPEGKIGLIDTENRRAEFYADVAGGWDHLDLQPPYTPDRYVEAMHAFEAAGGYGCIIVDSLSHVWEGQGGVLEMADAGVDRQGKPYTGLKKWQAPKMAYKRMVNALLRAPFHVIFCLRAKDKVEQRGQEVYSDGSLVPIIDKRFVYEMTVSVQLGGDHVPMDGMKCPEDLLDAFPRGRKIEIETGAAIATWVGAGAEWDAERAALERDAREKAMEGTAAMQAWWKSIGSAKQRQLKPILADLRSAAAEADTQAKTPADDEDDLDNAFNEKPAPAQKSNGDALDGGISEPFCWAYSGEGSVECRDAAHFLETLRGWIADAAPADRQPLWNANADGREAVLASGIEKDMDALNEVWRLAHEEAA